MALSMGPVGRPSTGQARTEIRQGPSDAVRRPFLPVENCKATVKQGGKRSFAVIRLNVRFADEAAVEYALSARRAGNGHGTSSV